MPWPQFYNVVIMRGCPGWISGGWAGIILLKFLSYAYSFDDFIYITMAKARPDEAYSLFCVDVCVDACVATYACAVVVAAGCDVVDDVFVVVDVDVVVAAGCVCDVVVDAAADVADVVDDAWDSKH